jgi:hypothetical protein
MLNENDLMQKLVISKKMMDIHNNLPRNGNASGINMTSPEVESFNAPQAKYNLPQELMMEQSRQIPNPEAPTLDRIMNSKLPDEIKQLMIEHPIAQPNSMSGPTLSNELVEKASRLMGTSGKQKNESVMDITPSSGKSNASIGELKEVISSIVRETVEEVLQENGLLIESTNKSNDVFTFKVGKHIFEGRVTKIKKVR